MKKTPEEMMVSAKTYSAIKNKKGKKRVLDGYEDTFRYLRCAKHLSFQQIQMFFKENGIDVAYPTIINFSKHLKKSKPKAQAPTN